MPREGAAELDALNAHSATGGQAEAHLVVAWRAPPQLHGVRRAHRAEATLRMADITRRWAADVGPAVFAGWAHHLLQAHEEGDRTAFSVFLRTCSVRSRSCGCEAHGGAALVLQ